MAYSAILKLGNDQGTNSQEYIVADCHCHFSREYNHLIPDSDARCERIDLTVIAPNKEQLGLYDWFVNASTLNGSIIFETVSAKDLYTPKKNITFEGAYCCALSEKYKNDGSEARMLSISIVADKITISGIDFDNFYK